MVDVVDYVEHAEVVTFIISDSSRALILLGSFSKCRIIIVSSIGHISCPHVLNAGHEMRSMEETMTILHFENDPRKINALEELEIMKATTSDRMLNIVHNINLLYQIPHSVQD